MKQVIKKEMTEEKDETIPVEENTQLLDEDTITKILLELESHGLTEDNFVEMRNKYGNVYISYIHEGGNSYIWKKLNRGEYKGIIESGAMNKELSYQEAVLRKCLLSPKPDQSFMISSDAGVIPTLFSQIMYQSGFIPEHIAITYIIEV